MISVVPAFAAVTVPSETVATASLLDDHTTVSVVLAGSTVAVNVKDSPVQNGKKRSLLFRGSQQ